MQSRIISSRYKQQPRRRKRLAWKKLMIPRALSVLMMSESKKPSAQAILPDRWMDGVPPREELPTKMRSPFRRPLPPSPPRRRSQNEIPQTDVGRPGEEEMALRKKTEKHRPRWIVDRHAWLRRAWPSRRRWCPIPSEPPSASPTPESHRLPPTDPGGFVVRPAVRTPRGLGCARHRRCAPRPRKKKRNENRKRREIRDGNGARDPLLPCLCPEKAKWRCRPPMEIFSATIWRGWAC